MKSKLGERGQIVIPKPYRDSLGLRPGELLEIREERGQLILSKTADDGPVAGVYGILRDEFERMGYASTDDFMRDIRGGDPDAVDPA